MHKKILLLVLLLIISSQTLQAAETIQKGDILTLQQCINTALNNHPAINAAAGTIRQSESKIGQARAGYYPQINIQSDYSRIGPAPTSLRSDPYNYYSNSLNLNQTLFDFGKTSSSVDIQMLTKQSAEADFQNTAASLVLGVKEAYYSFLKAKMSEIVAKETVNQFQQHFDVAETFFETGKSSKIDVTSAEVNLSNARIQLISVQNALHIARVTLNKAMGLISAPEYDVEEQFYLEKISISFETALAQAYENRPDLLSTGLKKEALEKGIEAVVFDRGGYVYHGRVKELADGAREAGLKF